MLDWLRSLRDPHPSTPPIDLRYCKGDDACIQYLERAISSWKSWNDLKEGDSMYEHKVTALRVLKNQIYFAGCDFLGDDKPTK